MRFLLINPRCVLEKNEVALPPIGLCNISAVLKQENYFVKGLNLDYVDPQIELHDLLVEYIEQYNIEVVAVGSLSNEYNQVKNIFKIVKEHNSKIITVLGGGILNYDTQVVFENLQYADIGVIGEGERTIVHLAKIECSNELLQEVRGIIFKSENKIIITQPVELIKDLDSLPYPDFDEFDIKTFFDLQLPTTDYKYFPKDNPKLLTLFASRSCPYGCTFCSHTIGKKYRSFSLDYFFDMLDCMIERYDLNLLQIIDELFSMKKERLIEFCHRIKKYNIIWFAQTRVDEVDEEILTIMRDAGCYFMSYGIEHINGSVLKSMKKKIKLPDIEKALAYTYKLNMGVQGNILIGDLAETQESFHEACAWMLKNQKYQINFTPLLVYPGTKIYNYAEQQGIIPDTITFLEKDMSNTLINLTKMDDRVFKDVHKLRFQICEYVKVYGNLIDIKYTKVDKYYRELNEVLIECGHCKKENRYKNFYFNKAMMVGDSFKMGCRHCNQKYDFVLDKVYEYYKKRVYTIVNNYIQKQTPICLVGYKNEVFLRKELEFLNIDIERINFVRIFDNDDKNANQNYLNNHTVESYDATTIAQLDAESVFLIPAFREEEKAFKIKQSLIDINVKEESIFLIHKLSLFSPKRHYLDKTLFNMVR